MTSNTQSSDDTQKNEVTLEQALLIAQNQLNNRNLFAAEQTYQDVLKIDEENGEAYFGLALVNYHKGLHESAIGFLEKSLEISPKHAVCFNVYGVVLASLGRHQEALDAWNKAVSIQEDFAEAYCNMSNLYWTMGDNEAAIDASQKAIDIDPNNAEAYYTLSNPLVNLEKSDEAIAALKKSIEIKPEFANSHINLGNALRDQGRALEAEEYSRKGVELAPDNAIGHNNLGNILRDQGHVKDAEQCYRKAISLRTNYKEAHNNLCLILMDQFKYEEAIQSAKYAISYDDTYVDAYMNLSGCSIQINDLKTARTAAEKALQLNPESALSNVTLATIMFLEDRYEEAEVLMKKAMEMKPDSVQLYVQMADILEHSNRIDKALEMLDEAEKLNPEMPYIYHKKSTIYFTLNNLKASLKALDRCLELNDKYLPAFASRAETLQSLGEMDESTKVIRQGLEINNDFPFLYYSLSKIKKFESEDDPDLKKMIDLVENSSQWGKQQEACISFSLFKAWQDLGNYEEAFKYLARGNAAKKEIIPFSQKAQDFRFNRTKEFYTPEFFDAVKDKGCDSDVPIFIVGMPRSGTTLTEQIISSHSDIFGAGELPDLADVEHKLVCLSEDNCQQMGQNYVDRIQKLSNGERYITDKMPGNFMRVGQIIATLPNAKIIHCMRDPIDTCLSCYKQLFARGQYWSYDLENLGHHHNSYRDLMAFWNDLFPGRILNIQYEETVNDLEAQVKNIFDFIGIEPEEACFMPHKSKRPILTASKGQVRKPVYKTSVKAWQRYEEQLQPLIKALES